MNPVRKVAPVRYSGESSSHAYIVHILGPAPHQLVGKIEEKSILEDAL